MIRWLALVLVLLPTVVGGGSGPDEHTVWEDEEEARQRALELDDEDDGEVDGGADAPGRD